MKRMGVGGRKGVPIKTVPSLSDSQGIRARRAERRVTRVERGKRAKNNRKNPGGRGKERRGV